MHTRVRELRRQHHWTHAELAKRVGRDQSTISRWETGRVAIPDDAKRTLAALFDVSIEYLMGWDRVPAPKPRRRPGQHRAAAPAGAAS